MYDDDLGRGDYVSEPEVDEDEFEEESSTGQANQDLETEQMEDEMYWEDEDELFSDSFKFEEVEEELESTSREYRTSMEENIEALRRLRVESQEFMNEYGAVIGDRLTKFEDLKDAHEEFVEEQRETFQDLRRRYNRLKDRTESLHGLKDDHVDLMTDYIHDLEDFAYDRLADAGYKLAASGILATLGFGAAEFYDDDFGIAQFYLNSPEIYGDSPAMAVLTLGLPVLGALYLRSSIHSASEYADLKNEADEMKEKRRRIED